MPPSYSGLALLLVAFTACDDGASKAKELGKKVDNVVDKLDRVEADDHLAAATQAFAAGKEAPEACTWAKSAAADTVGEPARATVADLRRRCALEPPLIRASRAVTLAEAARAEQPQAPTLTECQSDEYPKAAAILDRDHAGNARWTDLKARWAKICP